MCIERAMTPNECGGERGELQGATFKLRMDARKNQPCQELMRKRSQVKGIARSQRYDRAYKVLGPVRASVAANWCGPP